MTNQVETNRPLPGVLETGRHWLPIRDGDPRGLAIYRRHYSARRFRDGRKPKLFVGPGEKMVLLAEGPALLVWRKFIDDSGQTGVNCAVFRNEGKTLSSVLIREACQHAWTRWPGERLYTYVNPEAVESTNPGYCFQQAGWSRCGATAGGLTVLEITPIGFANSETGRIVKPSVCQKCGRGRRRPPSRYCNPCEMTVRGQMELAGYFANVTPPRTAGYGR